jgi:Flp pilus assembly protein TadG
MPGQNTFWPRFSLRQRGAALVEYAFICIVFFSLIFGISGFGHALYVYHAVNNAAKEGTRWAAVNGYLCGTNTGGDGTCDGTNGMNNGPATTTDIINHVQASLPASLQSSNAVTNAQFLHPTGSPPACTVTVGTLPAAEPNYPGCTVQVSVAYSYSFYFPLLPTPSAYPSTSACYGLPAGALCISTSSQMVIAH